jgi:hypothetical protein
VTDYIPIFVPSRVITLTTSGDVAGGDVLSVTGSSTVAKCPVTGPANWVGVAALDAKANTPVTVYGRGYVHEGLADGVITAGDQLLASATTGRQVKALAPASGNAAADINSARSVIGCALTSAADAVKVRWMQF